MPMVARNARVFHTPTTVARLAVTSTSLQSRPQLPTRTFTCSRTSWPRGSSIGGGPWKVARERRPQKGGPDEIRVGGAQLRGAARGGREPGRLVARRLLRRRAHGWPGLAPRGGLVREATQVQKVCGGDGLPR